MNSTLPRAGLDLAGGIPPRATTPTPSTRVAFGRDSHGRLQHAQASRERRQPSASCFCIDSFLNAGALRRYAHEIRRRSSEKVRDVCTRTSSARRWRIAVCSMLGGLLSTLANLFRHRPWSGRKCLFEHRRCVRHRPDLLAALYQCLSLKFQL